MKKVVFFLILLLSSIFWSFPITAQDNLTNPGLKPVRYELFNRQTLGEIQINIPQPAQITPVSINTAPMVRPPGLPNRINPIFTDNAIEEQNQRILQQHNMLPGQITTPQQVKQFADVERDLMEESFYREHIESLNKTAVYRQTFNILNQFDADSFSITNAVFLVENAFLDNKLPYKDFLNALKLRAELVCQILKREHLDSRNNIALNYGIQKLYAQPNAYYNPAPAADNH